MRNIFFIIIIAFLFACQNNKVPDQDKDTIIRLTIDSAIRTLNDSSTHGFWVDFSRTTFFDKTSIDKFLSQNKNFSQTNADSLLKNDSIWTKYGFLTKTLIKYKSVDFKQDTIIINLDRIKATDGSRGFEIKIIKLDNVYKVISSKTTWIS